MLFILDHFNPHVGWVETLFSQLTANYYQSWNKVIILTNNQDKKLKNFEIIQWIEVYRVGTWRQNRIKMIITGYQLIEKHNVNIIHTSTYSAALPAWILSKIFYIPNQIHIHEIYGELWHCFLGYKAYCNKWFEKLVVWLLPRDNYICVSHYTLNSVRTHFNLPDHKLQLQSNPLDTQFRETYSKDYTIEIKKQKYKQLNDSQISSQNNDESQWENKPQLWLYYGLTWV